jgi:hypothetical protein
MLDVMKVMSSFLGFLVLALLSPSAHAISYPTREVGGNVAPYTASILMVQEAGNWDVTEQMKDDHCSAVFYSHEYALTAAHCVEDVLPEQLYLGVGPSASRLRYCPVMAFEDHPRYLQKSISVNDIAVLRVFPDCYGGRTARLPSTGTPPESALWLYGWGLNQNSKLPERLGALHVADFSGAAPQFFGASFMPATQLAAGAVFRAEGLFGGACRGDSGGPLVSLAGGKTTLLGIVSWGTFWKKTCLLASPTVFTRVSYYRQWIASAKRTLRAKLKDHQFQYSNSGGDGIAQDGINFTSGSVDTDSKITRLTWWYEPLAASVSPVDFRVDLDFDFDGKPDLTARPTGVTTPEGEVLCTASADETVAAPTSSQPSLTYRSVSFPTSCLRSYGYSATMFVAIEAGGSTEAAAVWAVTLPPKS